MTKPNRQWRLVRHPVGEFRESDFEFVEHPVPVAAEGQFRARNIYLSLDPTLRIWASGKESYMPPVALGEVMRALWLGVVEDSRNAAFPVGTIVSGLFGMQDYAVSDGTGVTKVPADIPLQAWYAVYGHIGITAYFGLLEVGRAASGETVVVSGAAGAVGSLAGQIGKIQGCRVIGIAGGEAKCRWITDELGFDGAIDYRSEDVGAALGAVCPKGVDVYFENVGGKILDAVLPHINIHARIALCGMISQYTQEQSAGPSNLHFLLFKRAKIEGFLTSDYVDRAGEAFAALSRWLEEGKIRYRVDLVDGLENAVTALNRLFRGSNTGKLLVRVSPEP